MPLNDSANGDGRDDDEAVVVLETGRRDQHLICEGWFASHADSGTPGPHLHLRTSDAETPVLRTDQLPRGDAVRRPTVKPELGRDVRRAPRPGRCAALHLAAAAVLGLLADVGLEFSDATEFLFVAASPWVLLSFSAGRSTAPRWSAALGAATLLTGLAVYYLWLMVGMGVSFSVLTGSGFKALLWVAVGVVVGLGAGAVGGMTRLRGSFLPTVAWSGAAAVPCADGFIMTVYGPSPVAAAVIFGCVAVTLVTWACRCGVRPLSLAVGVPTATVALLGVELTVLQQAFGRLTWI